MSKLLMTAITAVPVPFLWRCNVFKFGVSFIVLSIDLKEMSLK